MTIKTRNILLLVLLIVSLSLLLADSTLLFYNLYKGTLTAPDTFPVKRVPIFFTGGYSFSAVILSIFIFLIYAAISVFYVYFEFEKTQSTEIIFFAMFLVGCLSESLRLCIPFFNLWHTISSFLVFSGRIVIFGRTIAPLALLFVAVFSGTEQRQYVERNLIILIIVAVTIALLLPLDTVNVLPNCCVLWGFSSAFLVVRILVLAATALSLFINSFAMGRTEKTPYGFLGLAVGYEICCYSSSYASLIPGAALLFAGTAVYLGSLHSQYLWK